MKVGGGLAEPTLLPLQQIEWVAKNLPANPSYHPNRGCKTIDLYSCPHKYPRLQKCLSPLPRAAQPDEPSLANPLLRVPMNRPHRGCATRKIFHPRSCGIRRFLPAPRTPCVGQWDAPRSGSRISQVTCHRRYRSNLRPRCHCDIRRSDSVDTAPVDWQDAWSFYAHTARTPGTCSA